MTMKELKLPHCYSFSLYQYTGHFTTHGCAFLASFCAILAAGVMSGMLAAFCSTFFTDLCTQSMQLFGELRIPRLKSRTEYTYISAIAAKRDASHPIISDTVRSTMLTGHGAFETSIYTIYIFHVVCFG